MRAALLAAALLLAGAHNDRQRRSLTDNAEWVSQSAAAASALQNNNPILAEEKYREALKLTLSYELEDPGHASQTNWDLAQVELALGRKKQAEGLFSHALTLEEKSQDESESLMGEHFRIAGNFYLAEGKAKKAAKVFGRALDHDQTAEAAAAQVDWRLLTLDRIDLGNSLVLTTDYAGAQPLFEAALADCTKASPATDDDRHLCQRGLMGKADVLAGLKQIPEGSAIYQKLMDDHVEGACMAFAKMLRAHKQNKKADSLGCP